MWKRCTCFVMLIVMLALVSGSAYGAFNPLRDPAIIGWWTCDEGAGSVVADSSANQRNGRFINGNPAWRTGIYGNAITLNGPTLVEVPPMGLTLSQATMAGWLFAPTAQPEWASIIMHRAPGPASGFNMLADRQLAYHWNDAADTWSFRGNVLHPVNEWAHCALTVEPTKATFYLNGVQRAVNTVSHTACAWDGPIWFGGDGGSGWVARRMSGGSLDDICFFSRALTADEITSIMKGLVKPELASGPSPADGATDVPQDTSFSWKSGEGATAHNVYLGKSFADVNSASAASPKGVLASPSQTATTYTPASLLDYGQTYYWRIDEVAASLFKGDVWSFTVEPYAYPITGVKATASSAQNSMGPEKTVDGSGMTGDLHGTESTTMWMSTGVQPNWIQYEFNAAYKVYELKVWNSNQMIEPYIGFGAKDVTIECSVDGVTGTTLAGVPQFVQGTGLPGYAANNTVNFGGAMAKYVKLTINKNWASVATQTGFSEVRFSYVPVQAREPQPAAGATGVSISTTMNWRPGREATSHKVSFGTDPDAVANGTAAAKTVTGHTFDAGVLTYGTTYFWKVDEVGAAATYPGQVWSFTTQEFAIVEDFESYTDDEGNRIYETWIDGWTNSTGSTVGYLQAPFAEQTIIHGGAQSMPMEYNNVGKPYYSEANRQFTDAQDWTLNGATHLGLWFQGGPASYIDKGNGAFTIGASGHDIWDNADDFRFAYKQLNGNGSVVVKVESLINTNAWAKAGVMIREKLDAGSTMAYMIVSWSSGVSFGWRQVADGTCGSATTTAIVAPQWVKLTRTGNAFTAQYSADGKTWLDIKNPALTGPVVSTTINMGANVYIGLCVTSHNAATTTTAEFSGAATTGTVTGQWQQVWIGDDPDRTNAPAGLYVVVEDSTGKSKLVTHPDPAAAATGAWTRWAIPLSDFTSAGVKMTKVKKLTIGVGGRSNPQAGGAGMLYIDDIGFGRPAAK